MIEIGHLGASWPANSVIFLILDVVAQVFILYFVKLYICLMYFSMAITIYNIIINQRLLKLNSTEWKINLRNPPQKEQMENGR